MILTRDALKELDDRPAVTLRVEAWGGEVRLRPLSGAQRDAAMKLVADNTDAGRRPTEGLESLVASMGLVDENNEPIFTAEEMAQRSPAAREQLFNRIQEISAISTDADEALEGN
ncbi:MAG: hypothetical protein IMZ50_08810 [Candidatus Atribacteria bacterium]|nr:hypothetical protein [Candidatus Atribacteria bacterium]